MFFFFFSLSSLSYNITFPTGLANNPFSTVCAAAVNDTEHQLSSPRPAGEITGQLQPDLAF